MGRVAGNQAAMNVHCLGVESQIASQEYPSSCPSHSYVTTAQRYAVNSQLWTSSVTAALVDRKSTVNWCCSWPCLGGIQEGIAMERRVQRKSDFPLVKRLSPSPVTIPSCITGRRFLYRARRAAEKVSILPLGSPLKLVEKSNALNVFAKQLNKLWLVCGGLCTQGVSRLA